MTFLIGIASLAGSCFVVLMCHLFESDAANMICLSTLSIVYAVLLGIACDLENQLKSRIKALEDKTESNAEHIYQLSKKQSDKVIEYCVDCDEEDFK